MFYESKFKKYLMAYFSVEIFISVKDLIPQFLFIDKTERKSENRNAGCRKF